MIPAVFRLNNIVRGGKFARLAFSCHLFALLIFAFPAYGATTITLEAESGSLTAPMAVQPVLQPLEVNLWRSRRVPAITTMTPPMGSRPGKFFDQYSSIGNLRLVGTNDRPEWKQ